MQAAAMTSASLFYTSAGLYLDAQRVHGLEACMQVRCFNRIIGCTRVRICIDIHHGKTIYGITKKILDQTLFSFNNDLAG